MKTISLVLLTIFFSSCVKSKCVKSHKEKISVYNYYGTEETNTVTFTVCDSSIKK